jgi:TolA-binding protein
MFLKYLEPIFKPYRMMRNYIVSVRTTRGNIMAEAARVKRFGNQAKGKVAQAKGEVAKVQGQAKQAQGQAAQMQGQAAQMQGQMQQMQGQIPGRPAPQGQARGPMPPGQMPRAQMSPGQLPVAMNPNPPIKTVGFFRRRKICTQCSSELDKTWDSCPYCAQAAQTGQPAAAAPKGNKTQAFMVEGGGSTRQMLAWLVPIDGPQRGELYTLSQQSMVGTEPTCQVVLTDTYMSTKHAEVKVEKGAWIVRDLGSTNGTYVNDQRISQRELVDGDFIRFGQSVTKFKSL